jgi:hypothetical protein
LHDFSPTVQQKQSAGVFLNPAYFNSEQSFMRKFPVPVFVVPAVFSLTLYGDVAAADEQARMSVSVVATGTDSTKSDGEWSKGTFSYRAAFTATVQTDGVLSDINMYDPQYAQKAMATAAATMAKIQAAQRGEFSDEEEVTPEPRYLMFIGAMDCPATLSIEVDEKLEGAYADVGGMQPYTMTFTGKSSGTEAERDMQCVSNNSVLDTKDMKLYRSTLGFPEMKGHYILHEKNRGNLINNADSTHSALPTLVSEYVFNTLRVAPVKGHSQTTLTPTEPVLTRSGPYGNYQGSVTVELSWNFEPL